MSVNITETNVLGNKMKILLEVLETVTTSIPKQEGLQFGCVTE